ncbi:hypothetical protein KJ682_07615 [bacterium]|nr:hypothetical protein [bacterium]
MKRLMTALVMMLLIAWPVCARPVNGKAGHPEYTDRASAWISFTEADAAKTQIDTIQVFGGPGIWEGKFENEFGPDWQGWTHRDLNEALTNHWHVSTYYAAGLNGHGPGNRAMWCGDSLLAACSPSDSVGGVASGMLDDLKWERPVADPGQAVTVRLTGWMHYDLADAGWDFLELFVMRGGLPEMLGQWTGSAENVYLDFSTTILPGEYSGFDGDEVRLFFRVWSDGGWDDQDCLSPSHGACQLDDITVSFDGTPVTFDDFEEGSPVNWGKGDFVGVGDFAALRNNLPDQDPCRDNPSYQVSFIDDGVVVPETGGTPCITWCYGPGGWILNNDGGKLADDPSQDWFLENQVESPPIPWAAGLEGALFEFDVYVHETLCAQCPGIFYAWHVRSTDSSDPEDLALQPWKNRNFVHYGGPEYRRHTEQVGDLLVEGARWVQLALEVNELGWIWGWNGSDGTPAPYFDNVSLKGWEGGPQILVQERFAFKDGWVETGALNPANLSLNSCRIDIPNDINSYSWEDGIAVPGDSMLADITSTRAGATIMAPPILHWVMSCNPVFDGVRPAAPGPDQVVRGSTEGRLVHSGGILVEGRWSFDLPDSGWFFPGDVLHYYLTAEDDLAGDVRTAVWPPDTTRVLDFSVHSSYPDQAEIRALPTALDDLPAGLDQPSMLVCLDGSTGHEAVRIQRALAELGFVPGLDFDLFTVRPPNNDFKHGLASIPPALRDGYRTLVYSSGRLGNSLTGDQRYPGSDAVQVGNWLAGGNRRALFLGESLVYDLIDDTEGQALASRLAVSLTDFDISTLNGGIRDLQVTPVVGNGILPDVARWFVDGDCPDRSAIDAITATPDGFAVATLDPRGGSGGPYAGVVLRDDLVLSNRTAVVPLDLSTVLTPAEGFFDGVPMAGRTRLLGELLDWLGESGSGFSDVPEAGVFAISAYPNPFNPTIALSYTMPQAGHLSLKVFDLRGRLVRTLLDERREAGPGRAAWDGLDEAGARAPSGVYFYEARTAGQVQVGKVTMIK